MYIYTHSHIYVCIKYCLSPYKELMCLVPMGSLKNALKPKHWSLKQMMPTNSYGRKLFFSLHVYIYMPTDRTVKLGHNKIFAEY